MIKGVIFVQVCAENEVANRSVILKTKAFAHNFVKM